MAFVNLTDNSPDTYEAIISELKFVETDAVPFFQLGTESSINQAIASPLQAQAPFIDYSNNNFSLIDSLNISETIFVTIPSSPSVGSSGVVGGVTINTTFTSSGGFGVTNPSSTPPPIAR
jgi:hypothetical protein